MIKIFVVILFILNNAVSQTIMKSQIDEILKKQNIPKNLLDQARQSGNINQLDDSGLQLLENGLNNENKTLDDKKIVEQINEELQEDISNNDESDFSNAEEPAEEVQDPADSTNNLKFEEYFGYNVFRGNPELFQKSTLGPVDPNYLIGPGDEVIIMLWGETEFHKGYTVTKDGYLFINNLGQVFVNGLTLEKLEKKLFILLKKVYASLDPKNQVATTFFDVSLGSLVLKPLRIFVLGDVDQPGAYAVKNETTLFSALYYFNGPSIDGSLRDIKLIREEKEVSSIDFYDYLLLGKKTNDIRLQRDDVIFIPPRGKTVKLAGEINKPFYFELKKDEGLAEIIKMTGGIKSTTYTKRAQIDRILNPELRTTLGIDRLISDVDLTSIINSKENFELLDGDLIEFFKISDQRSNYVLLNGPVLRPGKYQYEKGFRLKDLITKADGVTGEAYTERVDIVRYNSDNTQSHIDVNLRLALQNDPENNIELQSLDEVTVHNFSTSLYKKGVELSGHVKFPGIYPYQKDMQVYDLIFNRGGFENDEFLKNTYLERAELIRNSVNKMSSKKINFRLDSVLVKKGIADMELEMGDKIIIYSREDVTGIPPGVVEIEGRVKYPGVFDLHADMTIRDLVIMAGGYEDSIWVESMVLERADLVRTNFKKLNKEIIYIDLNKELDTNFSSTKLIEGDLLRVYDKLFFPIIQNVRIAGEVVAPGTFEYKSSMSVKDLILEAGGVNENIHSFRADISRINKHNKDANKFADVITIYLDYSLNTFTTGNSKNNIVLEPNDFVVIRKSPNFVFQESVNITGAVLYPGDYVVTSTNEKVSEIISRAGGLSDDAYPDASSVIRNGDKINISFSRLLKNPKTKYNFRVMPGDSINIGIKPSLVEIRGEVNAPGFYQFVKGNRANDYISGAGGINKNGTRRGSFVTFPNGKSIGLNPFSNPKIKDGSVIEIIPEEEMEPFSLTEYVTNLTSIWADLSQAYLVILVAGRQ